MEYTPLNYEQLNLLAGTYMPSSVKAYNNKTFAYWERSLFQRAISVIKLNGLPEDWEGEVKDFLYYCLFKFGYVAVFDNDKFGFSFQPCTLSGFNFYYQPVRAIISNPAYNAELEIHKECEILKLTPDYSGIWDIIALYAEKLSALDSAINMSIINNKVPFLLGAKNKAVAQTLKKIMDKVNQGEPLVIYDSIIEDVANGKETPFQLIDREHLKNSYITSDQLLDAHTILQDFDTEIGIPTIPYQKKERMVTDEANSKVLESSTRATIWVETLNSSLKKINNHYGSDISASLRFDYGREDNNELIKNNNDRV